MDQIVINAKTRTETGKSVAKNLRAAGRLPAVMYNEKGEATMLEIDAAEFSKVWRTVTPTTLITLKVDGKDNMAYIQDTEYDIKSDKNLHADFHVVSGELPLTARMKVNYTGTPAGVLAGGFLLKHVPEVTIKALPKDLPARIVADISSVKIGDNFRVKDLNLGDKITVLTDAEASLVSVSPAR
ncbi:MAG: 50S ribosomal protein L25 [Treponema sp.]|nr:50S ribosomal protein L25 [Treponema sp.]